MLDLLKEVVVAGAVLVLEGEGAVGGDACHAGHEAAILGVLPGVQLAVVALEGGHVAPVKVSSGLLIAQGVYQLLDA